MLSKQLLKFPNATESIFLGKQNLNNLKYMLFNSLFF